MNGSELEFVPQNMIFLRYLTTPILYCIPTCYLSFVKIELSILPIWQSCHENKFFWLLRQEHISSLLTLPLMELTDQII